MSNNRTILKSIQEKICDNTKVYGCNVTELDDSTCNMDIIFIHFDLLVNIRVKDNSLCCVTAKLVREDDTISEILRKFSFSNSLEDVKIDIVKFIDESVNVATEIDMKLTVFGG